MFDLREGAPRPIRQLRDLTRMRVQLQRDRNRVINRIGRLLETVNSKLGSVASNIVGKSGRAIVKAITRGHSQPEALADLAVGQLKAKKSELALAQKDGIATISVGCWGICWRNWSGWMGDWLK